MELITVSEAAKRDGVRREAIYYSIKHGKLTAHREYGNMLIDAVELGTYKRRASSKPEPTKFRTSARGFLAGTGVSVESFLEQKLLDKALER